MAKNRVKLKPVHHRASTSNRQLISTHMANLSLESPVNLSCMSLDCWRKPEHKTETPAGTGRTWKLHTERLQPSMRFKPRTCDVFFSFYITGPTACRTLMLVFPFMRNFMMQFVLI